MSKEIHLQKTLFPLLKEVSCDVDSFLEATTNLQLATQESIVFYRMTNSPLAEKNFSSRFPGKVGCLITNRLPEGYDGNYALVEEKDFLEAQKRVADQLYPLAKKNMTLLGVTGTNGKTTTVEFIRQVCCEEGISVATIGTLGFYKNEERVESQLNATSPSYLELRKLIFECGEDISTVAIEVSSHALDQNRFYDLKFSGACWTSFSQDHLDYHDSLDEYFNAKLKIVEKLSPNSDLLVSERSTELKSKLQDRTRVTVLPAFDEKSYERNPLFQADYNKVNFELAYALLNQVFPLKYGPTLMSSKMISPAGRFMTRVDSLGRMAVVDYAHTPEALENICQTLRRSLKSGEKLLTVFGCGGDRDKRKRSLMGEIACRLSDAVIITDDNPRTEPSGDIIADIEKGCSGAYEIISQREKAIQKAVQSEDFKVILIAGKGHEEYQEVNGEKSDFSDIRTVEKYMENSHDG